MDRSDEKLEPLRRGLRLASTSLIYGTTNGSDWNSMQPFEDTATRFLLEVLRFPFHSLRGYIRL